MTVDEFLVWDADDATGRRWQLVDGKPVLMAPTSATHGALQAEIGRLVGNHLLEAGLLCRVIIALGIVPRLRANENFRVPALEVTCAPPSQLVMTHEPVLLVEILSPTDEADTRANVWTYTTIPSVQEILLVRSTRMEAELLRWGGDGMWPEQPAVIRAGDMLELTSVDFAAPLSSLYRTTGLAG
jgi:Uma2 family endonuclease